MIDGMRIEEMWSVMKRASASPLSSPQLARQFFVTPFIPQQTSVDATSTSNINGVINNVLLSDQTPYHDTFQFLDNQDALDLDFSTNPIDLHFPLHTK